MATIQGTSGNDNRIGTSTADLISGYGGDDTLDGRLGNDRIYGGNNNDTLYGDFGVDRLYGGTGNDYLSGGAEDDFLLGESGNDTLYGGTGNDTLSGGTGNDTYFIKGEGTDQITEAASAGTDTVQSAISYTLGANLENLTLTRSRAINGTGNALNNRIVGNDATNVIRGGLGNDTIDGNQGNDVIEGGDGADVLSVANTTEYLGESATLRGGAGNDTLNGGRESQMYGGSGNDVLNSGIRDSFLNGEDGNDFLNGGLYSHLSGGNGNDTLTGSAVVWNGGAGDDILRTLNYEPCEVTGGSGADRFGFTSAYESSADITDFSVADDTINVSTTGFAGGLTTGAVIRATQFRIGPAAADTSDRFIYDASIGALFFDSDGTGTAEQVQFATLSTGLAMTNNDIFVV